MGRYPTGAITTGGSIRLELSYLLKNGFIEKNFIKKGSISWNNGNSISFISCFDEKEQYIRLIYSNTSCQSGEVTSQDYKIQLTTIPSNLGKGEIIYFVCPVSGRRARILYKVYGSLFFKSRLAYRHRIYYSGQICQKPLYDSERFHAIEKQLERLPEGKKSHYKGKETRLQKKRKELEEKKAYHEWKSFLILDSYFQKMKPF